VSAAKVMMIALMEEAAFKTDCFGGSAVTVHATVILIANMDKDAMSVGQLGQQQPVLQQQGLQQPVLHIAGAP